MDWCSDEPHKSDGKENTRQPQLCSMPASAWPLRLERFSFVLRTSWAWAGSTIPQAPKERQFIAWGVSPRTQRDDKRKRPVHEGPTQTMASPQAVAAFRVQAS